MIPTFDPVMLVLIVPATAAAILEMRRFILPSFNHSCGVDVEKPVLVPFRRTPE